MVFPIAALLAVCAAIALVQPTIAQEPTRRALRALCSGYAQDNKAHPFVAEEEDHCPSLSRMEAWELEIERADCHPREVMVQLKTDDEHEFHPSVVAVKRCVGHCDSSSCIPTKTSPRMLQVTRTNVLTRATKCGLVKLEEHQACDCLCEVKSENCNKWQVYDASSCRCRCANPGPRRNSCKKGVWDEDACECLCPREVCPLGEEWVAHRCRCVKMAEQW